MTLAALMRYPTLSLLVLTACQVGKTSDKASSSSSSDTVIDRVSHSRDTVTSSQATPLLPAGVYRDSIDVFDPDGYYFPIDTLTIDGRTIKTLELHTLDFNYGGELHYARPRLVQPPDVQLTVSEGSSGSERTSDAEESNDKTSTSPCAAARIAADSLSLRCAGTGVGDVSIEGHFLDKGRFYADKFAEQSVDLLVARVVISRDGRIIHDAVHRFRYFAGE